MRRAPTAAWAGALALGVALLAAAGLQAGGDSLRRALALDFGEPAAAVAAGEGGHDDPLLAGLEDQLRRNPRDVRALIFKARLDVQAQRHQQAVDGYAQALAGRSKAALDAGVWVEYAEAVGLAQGGRLAGQPRALIDKALALAPDHPQALDLAGSAAWEAGEFDLAQHHWRRLLRQLPEGSTRHLQLTMAIDQAERRARFTLPTPR